MEELFSKEYEWEDGEELGIAVAEMMQEATDGRGMGQLLQLSVAAVTVTRIDEGIEVEEGELGEALEKAIKGSGGRGATQKVPVQLSVLYAHPFEAFNLIRISVILHEFIVHHGLTLFRYSVESVGDAELLEALKEARAREAAEE